MPNESSGKTRRPGQLWLAPAVGFGDLDELYIILGPSREPGSEDASWAVLRLERDIVSHWPERVMADDTLMAEAE